METDIKNLQNRIVNSFPFYYHDELLFYKPEKFDNVLFMRQLEREFHGILQENRIPIRVNIHYKPDNITGNVSISISLFESNLLLTLFLAFGFFFLFHQSQFFGIASIMAGILYYFLNIHVSIASIKKSIIRISGITFDLGESELWKKQQVWMENEHLCPACGEQKNPYSYRCINCGIHFRNPNKQEDNAVINTTGATEVTYQYQKKNEKNSR
jgi:hypothetical protein